MKPNIWISSPQAVELLAKQLATWPLAEKNYRALLEVQTRTFDLDGFCIKVQFNPARILSSGAKVDARSLAERPCFLCPDQLPVEQERLPFGFRYLVLCNPYPIFPQHFTIPSREHAPQQIASRLDDFLDLAQRLEGFTIFYNGPKSGASAPDHAHFQAVTASVMPIDDEIGPWMEKHGQTVIRRQAGSLSYFTQYLRNGFVIEATSHAAAAELFHTLYEVLEIHPGETEPRMNLFGRFAAGAWRLIVVPRRQHRPWQYAAPEPERLLASPGAADIGGLFITVRKEDFEKISPELLRNVYEQVCLGDREVEEIAGRIR